MKTQLIATLTSAVLAGIASADFDTAVPWGDAATDIGIDGTGDRGNGRASGTLTIPSAGIYEITSGGADFWGGGDQATAIYDSTGSYTTTGDLTATVRHVGVNIDSQDTWGRGVLMMRKTQGNPTAGVPEANDTHYGVFRRSQAAVQMGTIRRASDGGLTRRGTTIGDLARNLNSDVGDNLKFIGREDQGNPVYMSVARQGNRFWSGYAIDLDGNGTPGRFVVHNAIDSGVGGSALLATGGNASNPNGTFGVLLAPNDTVDTVGIAATDEVTVVLGHQAHNSGGILGGGTQTNSAQRVNTATFDDFTYTGSFDGTKFNATAENDTWEVDGSIALSGDQVIGSAFVRDHINNSGNATGESVGWRVTATGIASFKPTFGPDGSVKRVMAMEAADIVPAANFRLDSASAAGSGLTAKIYTGQGNPGNLAAIESLIAPLTPSGTATIPNVAWTGNGDNDANYYGLTGPASFGVAVQGIDPADSTMGSFSGDENSYGVDITGEIFIPANGGKQDFFEQALGKEWIVFKDGVDDFTYLEIDGVPVLNDNNWTSDNSTGNGGGNIALFDCSDPKYDDGEWVSFRMIFWEGTGGDSGILYWDVDDTNDSFVAAQLPGAVPGVAEFTQSGVAQVGDESSTASFGITLPGSLWSLNLEIYNTATTKTVSGLGNVASSNTPLEKWYFDNFATTSVDPNGDPDTDMADNFMEYAFGMDPNASDSGPLAVISSEELTPGMPTVNVDDAATTNDVQFTVRFVRRLDPADPSLVYTPQFSHDMTDWVDDSSTPVVVASDGCFEVVEVTFPYAIPSGPNQGRKPRFFRVSVSSND